MSALSSALSSTLYHQLDHASRSAGDGSPLSMNDERGKLEAYKRDDVLEIT